MIYFLVIVVIALLAIIGSIILWYERVRSGRGAGRDAGPNQYDGGFIQSNMLYDRDRILKILNNPLLAEVIAAAKTVERFSDIVHRITYDRSRGTPTLTYHNGQLKLFLTELQFLTESCKSHTDKLYVVYAGSAPSMKLPILANMFPETIFILIDPNEHYLSFEDGDMYDYPERVYFFKYAERREGTPGYTARVYSGASGRMVNLNGALTERSDAGGGLTTDELGRGPRLADIVMEGKYRYYIIEDLMSRQLAEILRPICERPGTLFISDIRTREEHAEYPTNGDLAFNGALILNCIRIMGCARNMLKFRVPYDFEYDESTLPDYAREEINICGIDFAANFRARKFQYVCPDDIYLQAFAGRNSTELRLICSPPFDLHFYDTDEYNDKLYYYNRLHRIYGYHETSFLSKPLGIDRCGDCALMSRLFDNYYSKFGVPRGDHDLMRLFKVLNIDTLRLKTGHGYYFDKYDGPEHCIDTHKSLILIDFINTSYQNIHRYRGPINVNNRLHFIKHMDNNRDTLGYISYNIKTQLAKIDFFGPKSLMTKNLLVFDNDISLDYEGRHFETVGELWQYLNQPSGKPEYTDFTDCPMIENLDDADRREAFAFTFRTLCSKRPLFINYSCISDRIGPLGDNTTVYSIAEIRAHCIRVPHDKVHYLSLMRTYDLDILDRPENTIFFTMEVRLRGILYYFCLKFLRFRRAKVYIITRYISENDVKKSIFKYLNPERINDNCVLIDAYMNPSNTDVAELKILTKNTQLY